MNDFAGSADAIAEKLVAGGMDPQQAMMMALRLKQEPNGSLALRPVENMSVIGKSMNPPGLPESVVSDTVGIIKNMDDASVIATASRMTGLPFDSPIQARLMLEKMLGGGASISAGLSGIGSGLPQRLTGYEVGARFPALGGQVGVGAAIPRGQGSPAINLNYQRQFQEGGSVLASDTDKIAEQLIAGGVDPQQAMTLALRMAQSRQQADQSILGGVPTQPPVSDVPPATEILGGDPSKLFQRQPTTMERIKDLPKDVLGAADAMASMGSLVGLAVPSMMYALRPGQKTQGDPMEFALRNMYMPRSERGPSHLAGLGEVLESLPQTGPLPELQAFTGVGRGVGRQLAEKGRQAGRAMAPAAANVAEDILRRQGLLMDVVKPKGGNFIGGNVPENIDRQLKQLTSAYDPEVALEDVRQMRQQFGDLPRYAEAERTIQNQKAMNQWVTRNLSNYVKKEMGTPEDPVRKLAETGVTHIQETYGEPGSIARLQRQEAGFPAEGMGVSPQARSWENLSDRALDNYLAGLIQPQSEYIKDFERLNRQLSNVGNQIKQRFVNERTERLVKQGEAPENAKRIIEDLVANKPNAVLARELGDESLLKEYVSLRAKTNYAREIANQEYADILRENPWIEKLDPNSRLYTARTETLQFDHIVDVLRDDLDSGRIRPEQLNKVSVADAVRRTYEFDQEMAKKAEQAQAELANKLLNESPFKVYDNGYKWVKLPDPASSDEAMKLVQDIGCQGGWCTQKEANALYYGAHGEGNNLFVLMSPDKRVHAQIHVQSPKKPYDFDALMSDPQTKAQAAQAVREWRQRNPNVEAPLEDDQIYQALREAGIPEQSPLISEIKPRSNSWTSQMVADQVEKDPEYKKTIRNMLSDFVQTTKYPVEWDLENAGLVAIDRASDLAKAMRAAKEEVPRYVTNEELSKLLQKYVPQQYKQGGSVNHKAVESARRALEKAMAKGGEVKMGTGGSMLGTVAGKAAGKAGKAAKKSDDEKTLPMVLQRSPAKTKEELQAEAERVGRQIIGEHVTKPGDTANLADYSKKVSERLRAMQEGQDYVLKETTPTSPLANVNPAVGSILVGLPGDISIADKKLMSLGKLKIGSQQQGGSLYGVPFMDDPEELAKFWASNYGPANIFQNKVTELGGMYPEQDILGAYMSMGRTGMNFAQHFADANLRAIQSAIKAGDVSKQDIASFNKMIRDGWSKINQKTGKREYFKYPEFAGIEKTGESYAQMMLDPELRKWFNDRMKTGKETAPRGLPSGVDIEYAISEPALRNLEHSLVGYSVGKMQPGRDLISPVDHATYSHGIPGQAIGRLAGHVPARLAFSDASKVIAETKRPQDFTGTIQKVFPHQVVDQQWQDEIGQYLEYLKSFTGKKKGGQVTMAGGGALSKAATAAARKSAKSAKKSDLPQQVLSQEETAENLRRFLEQSQVKDRLYHATPKDFKEFKPGGEDPTLSGPAIWLSTDARNQPAMHNISAGRAGEFREGTNVMPVYAQAKNPLVLDDPTMIDWAQAVFAGGSREFPELLAPKWVEEIRKEGYDSIMFADPRRTGQTHEVIMFEPNKIKSAIGNRGTYDTREADITKRKGGLAALRK